MGAFYFRPHNDRYIVADQATKRMSSFAHALCLYIGPSVRHQAKQIVQKWSEHKMNEKKIAVPISRRYLAKLGAANARTLSVDIWANTKEAAEISRIPPAAVPGPLISGALWVKRGKTVR